MTAQLLRIGDDIVAFFAIVTDEGVTLIDAGWPRDLGILKTALQRVGRSLDDIRGLVLTHGDSDHRGVAEALRARHGVPAYILAADADTATGAAPAKDVRPDGWRLGPALQFLWALLRRGGFRTRPLTEVVAIADGDILPLPGAPEIIAIPGHSPGSAAIRVDAVDAIFLGDAVTTRHALTGARGMRLAPFSLDTEQTRRSLERLRSLPERRLFPAHGPEFAGTVEDMISALDGANAA